MYGSVISDFEQANPDVKVNKSSWEGKFDYTERIAGNNSLIAKEIKTMSDPDTGWFTKTIAGLMMIPTFIVSAAIFAVLSIASLHSITSVMLGEILKIPSGIISIILIGIEIGVIFGIISVMQRTPT
jgi:hypothetical protein